MGDGGMVTTRREDLAGRVALLRTHADSGGYRHEAIGVNSRMDAFQAAILRVKLSRLEGWNAERRRVAALYSEILEASLGGSRGSDGASGPVRLPPALAAGSVHAWHQYVIRTSRRDELAAHLREHGIGCGLYYPIPLHLQPCFADPDRGEGSFPEAERACRDVLALPVYPGLSDEEAAEVCRVVALFFGACP
jgi:dTDP-4-amino-4,6-dideoxygalactose transaminase